ncbi:lanthionine synthetase C family protein [Shewanella youngdeokensis]|uniref:LanC-like protein n=1 Tax=Shewanella youngdeokensis TaxID=2999068 RepID=A0ABZ0JTR6_9GAMM|nr:LanC-like protein [Shewanella sp. DAU334]
MLFSRERHCDLGFPEWNTTTAYIFIEQLFQTIEQRFNPINGWSTATGALKYSLYGGDAGTCWSQTYLAKFGYGTENSQYNGFLDMALPQHTQALTQEFTSAQYQQGLLIGKLGLLVAQNADKSTAKLTQSIITSISELTNNTVCEYMWGSPGALAFAAFNKATTASYIPLIKDIISSLETQLIDSTSLGVKVWQQNLYSQKICHLGAVHGFAGNAFSIIKSLAIVDDKSANNWKSIIINTIKQTVIHDGSRANWPQSIDGNRFGRDELLVQFCHGAPGIICCVIDLFGIDNEFDQLMIGGAELAWQAGPPKKGVNLCHGIAGTGYCFLKLFKATGDEKWLMRARMFASLAIYQAQQSQLSGQYNLSLWNGDSGLAHFIHQCINATSDIPTMDYF